MIKRNEYVWAERDIWKVVKYCPIRNEYTVTDSCGRRFHYYITDMKRSNPQWFDSILWELL